MGGMRSPWKAVRLMSRLRETGRVLRGTIEEFIDANLEALEIMEHLGDKEYFEAGSPCTLRWNELVAALRVKLRVVLKANPDTKPARHSAWQADLVEAHAKLSGDPDIEFVGWCIHGAPVGVAEAIKSGGVFPSVGCLPPQDNAIELYFAPGEPLRNYLSVEEAKDVAGEEVGRVISKGYATFYPYVKREFGNVLVSKLACIVEERPDGTSKVRMVCDLRRSGYNQFVGAE